MKTYIIQVTFPDDMMRDEIDQVVYIVASTPDSFVFELDPDITKAMLFSRSQVEHTKDYCSIGMPECTLTEILRSDTELLDTLVNL